MTVVAGWWGWSSGMVFEIGVRRENTRIFLGMNRTSTPIRALLEGNRCRTYRLARALPLPAVEAQTIPNAIY